jgi:phosphatidate cytidylyltransferase
LKEFTIRSLYGALFVAVVILAAGWHPAGLFLLLSFVLVAGLHEFYNLSFKLKAFPLKISGILIAYSAFSISFAAASGLVPQYSLNVIPALILLLPVIVLFYAPDTFLSSFATTLAGIVYLALPAALFPWLGYTNNVYDYRIPLGVFFIIWTYDSFAYLVGVLIGKNRMLPSISPKKSWEGFFGGLLLTVPLGWMLGKFWPVLSGTGWMLLVVLIVITGTLGDFVESALKRTAGLKDSGSFMPGHGGILDRFDSFLFAVPFVYLYLQIVNLLT